MCSLFRVALLIGAVSQMMITNVLLANAMSSVEMAEPRFPPLTESIAVFDIPGHENPFVILGYGVNVHFGNLIFSVTADDLISSWRYRHVSGQDDGGRVSNVKIWQRPDQICSHGDYDIISWSGPNISYRHSGMHEISCLPRQDSTSLNGYVGAQLTLGGTFGAPDRSPCIIQSQEQTQGPNKAQNGLNLIKLYGVFSGFRHAPLFAQIGLVMILGMITLGLGPVGIGRLFPVWRDQRRIWSGLLFSLLGLVSFGLICGIVFLS